MAANQVPGLHKATAKQPQKFASQSKITARDWHKKVQQKKLEGGVDADRIIAKARKTGDVKLMRAALHYAIAQAQAEAAKLEAELEMMKAHMLVDALSIIDPTPLTTGVSIWMDYQEAQTR